MDESQKKNFNHLKIHSQYSICEGAIKIDELKDYTKENKIKAIALCDSENLCCLLYTSPSPRDTIRSRMPSSA